MYAPSYRQANGSAFIAPSPDGERALDRAFDDVKRAFGDFLRRRGVDRPFILAAHSQGAVHGEWLLYEVISGTPLAKKLVYAVLPGGAVTVEGLREKAPDLHACASPDDTGRVVAWNARGPGYRGGHFEMRRPDTRERLCTNPITWRLDGVAAPAADNRGAVFLETDDRAPRPAFASARCADGTLWVDEIGAAPRDLPSRILDAVMGPENDHPFEYLISFLNLRENADCRVRTFLTRGADASGAAPR